MLPTESPDMKLIKPTLQNVVINKPEPTIKLKQNMCIDKGYDYPEVYELLEAYGYTIHIRSRGEENRINSKEIPRYRLNTGLLKEPTPG